MAEQFLHGEDVIAVLDEVGGEGMTKGMATDAFLEACFSGGFFDGALQASFGSVRSAVRIRAPRRSNEKVSRLAVSANRETIKGKKGKNKRNQGAYLV